MLRVLIALMLASVALAGCAAEEPTAATDDTTAADETAKATATTGVIRGVVVDTQIVPIVGATVKINSLGLETTSLEDGSFAFSELEPGAYFISVSKVGYTSAQSSTQVEAGVDKPPVVRIQLVEDVAALPFYQTTVWSGHLRCGVMAVAITFPCSVIRGTEDTVGDYNSEVREFTQLPTFLQSQLHWKNTQPAGESLFFNYAKCCNNANFAENGTAQGPSPLMVNAHKHEMEAGNILEDGLEIRVFGGPYPGTENPGGTGLFGVGVQVEQPVNSFTSEFYNFLPPEGWLFMTDGDPVVPS